MTKRLVLLATVLMLVVVGCGGAKKAATPVGCGGAKKAATPKEAVLNMRDALADGNESAFVDCFDVDENGKKMLEAMFGMTDVMEEFKEKVTKAFSKEDAEKILGSQEDPFGELMAIKDEDIEVTLAEDGNSATCVVKGSDVDDMPLIKKDGVWLVQLDEDEAPSDEEVEQGLKMVEIMTGVFKEMGDKAGDDGMTAEKFEEEMGQKMMAAMFAAMAEMEPEALEEDE